MKPIIAYYRVSTGKQQRSGLGIEAQKEACHRFAAANGFEIVQEFTEFQSGKGHDALEQRPVLAEALNEAKKLDCEILCSKICRLSRSVSFVSGLMARGVPFIVSEYGLDAEPLLLHLFVSVAEHERRMISERTKAALRAKRAQGVRLGNQKNLKEAQRLGNEAQAKYADTFAENILPIIQQIQSAGMTSYQAVAETLNRRGIATARGKQWHPSTVRNLILRDAS